MKTMRLPTIAVILLTVLYLLCIPIDAQSVVEINGQLHVNNLTGQLENKYNYPIQLRGMSSHGLNYFPKFLNATSIRALSEDWGADAVRLSMYIQEGGYEEDPEYYTALVDSLIDVVTENGMYVLIDFHQLHPGDPNDNIEHAKRYFRHMAQKHSNKNNVFYEICNEPNGDVTWSGIKRYAEQIIPIIREYDNHNIVIVGTSTWAQDIDDVIGNELEDPNVMYTVHFYAASHKDWQRNKVKKAINANIPIFVTECGTQEASGDGYNDWVSSDEWFQLLEDNKISWINWNFSADRRSGAVFSTYPDTYLDYDYYTSWDNLKEAGSYIKRRLSTPEDDFGTTIDIDTSNLSENFVTCAKWIGSADSTGSSVVYDTTKLENDSLLVITISKGEKSPAWASLKADYKGSFEKVNTIKITYSSKGPAEVVLDNPNLDAKGVSHFFTLPTTDGKMTTLYLFPSLFKQPSWTPDTDTSTLNLSEVTSVSFTTSAPGQSQFVIHEVRLNNFKKGPVHVLHVGQIEQSAISHVEGALLFHNVIAPRLDVVIRNIQGKIVAKATIKNRNGMASYRLGQSLVPGMYIAEIRNGKSNSFLKFNKVK